jgi:hypothetical protein
MEWPEEQEMRTVRISEKADKDGMLHLRIAVGQPDAEFEAVIVLQPKAEPVVARTPEELGWPPGYFESTAGSITDETFVRPPQGEMPKPIDLD